MWLNQASKPSPWGGHFEELCGRKRLGQRLAQGLPLLRREQVALVDDDAVGFLQLLAIDVEHLVGKPPAAFQTEDTRRAHRVHEHAERRDGVVAPVDPPQRIRDGGDEVGATAHRLRQEHLRPGGGGKLAGGLNERVEPAAEAATGNLFHRELPRGKQRRVHQAAPLVVADEAHPLAALRDPPGQLEQSSGLARAEKAAEHHIAGLVPGGGAIASLRVLRGQTHICLVAHTCGRSRKLYSA